MSQPVENGYRSFLKLPADELLILRERARAIAPAPVSSNAVDEVMEVLEIQSRGQSFAIPLTGVEGISPLTSIAAVPRAPRVLRGLVSFRGEVLMGIELAALMGLGGDGLVDLQRVVALGADGLRLAILAERVLSVSQARPSSFSGASALGQQHRFVLGTDARFVSLLDTSALIAHVFRTLGEGR